MRTLFVWVADLALYYSPLGGSGKIGEQWDSHSWLQARVPHDNSRREQKHRFAARAGFVAQQTCEQHASACRGEQCSSHALTRSLNIVVPAQHRSTRSYIE